jgi:hypothetical protein
VAQSEIVHAFLEGTTCQDIMRELGRSPPADSNELFDIATSFASGKEAMGAISDGKISPPNVFARDIAQPSVALEPHPSNHTEPLGAPSSPTGAEPMDEDPSNEAYVLSLLKGYGASEAEVMDVEPAPNRADWRDKYVAWMD